MNCWAVVSIDANNPVMRVCVLPVKCKKCNHATVDVMKERLVVAVVSKCNCAAISAITAVQKSVMRKYIHLSLKRKYTY